MNEDPPSEVGFPPADATAHGPCGSETRAAAGRNACDGPLAGTDLIRILDTLGDTFIVLDRAWRFRHLNRHALRQAGEPPEQLLGRSIWEQYPSLLGTPVEVHYRRALADQVPVHFETQGVLSGQWFEIHAYPSPEGLIILGRDITERRQAEQALRESEEFHRAIAELSSDYAYVCRVDPDGTIELEAVTGGFAGITGYTLEELQARGGWRSLFLPEDLAEVDPRTKDLLAGRRGVAEVRIRTKDGRTRWIRYSAQPIWDAAENRVVRLYGAVQDITERRRAEAAQRESEERFRCFMDNGPALAWIKDEAGHYVYVNRPFEQRYQTALGIVRGRTDLDLWPAEVAGPFRASDRAVLAAGKPLEFMERAPDPDGSVRHWRVFKFLFQDAAGARYIGGMAVDATEHERAEEELRESEQRLRHFFEATFEGIAIHDHGRILDANQALAAMLGYELPDILGRHALDFAAPESRPLIRERIAAGSEDAYETTARRRDGSTFPVELRGRPITYQGRVVRVTAARDLTERKLAQRQAEEYAERLQDLSRRLLEVQEQERRHLARELHDEIGQLLTGLKLNLEMSTRLPAGQLGAHQAEAQVLLRDLTARVRDLSLRLRPTMLDDLGLLPALLWHFDRYTAQTQINVLFAHGGLEDRLPPDVETAAYRIVQEALTNVARHAGVGELAVRVWLDAGRLHLQIEDEGVGFEPQRVQECRGTGGLSGMHERVTLLGGRLEIHSRPGCGTRVTAELPAVARAAATANGSDLEPPRGDRTEGAEESGSPGPGKNP